MLAGSGGMQKMDSRTRAHGEACIWTQMDGNITWRREEGNIDAEREKRVSE